MHGVLFISLRDYLTSEYGADLAQDVFGDRPVFLLSESYDDGLLVELVGAAAVATGRAPNELVHDFGAFTAQTTFTRLYPAFFEIAPSAREFLLTVETRIHELVRATIPNAAPPQLRVEQHGACGVAIAYTSPRRLCVLLRGLVHGTARHFGETAAIEELTCMLRGEAVCMLAVTLEAARDV